MKLCTVDRVQGISVEDFESYYLNGETPLIIENYLDEWPARKWTLSLMKEKAGHNEVFVRRKTAMESYKSGLKYNIESMKFSEYIDNIINENKKSFDSYLAVQNIRKALPELEADLRLPKYVKKIHGGPFLWIAQKGHYEFCHFDPDDNFLIVLSGEKHVRLYPAANLHNLYPNKLGSKGKTIQSSINDCSDPDFKMFPELGNATCYECTVKEGEMLFFPAFWWHQVTSTKQTISINIFFGNDGDNSYLSKVMSGNQWESFKYWLLNIVEQNKNKSQFQMVLQHLEESLTNFLLKQWHEIPSEYQLDILVRTILDYCELEDIPTCKEKKRHAPPLKIRGLLWRS